MLVQTSYQILQRVVTKWNINLMLQIQVRRLHVDVLVWQVWQVWQVQQQEWRGGRSGGVAGVPWWQEWRCGRCAECSGCLPLIRHGGAS